MTRIAAQFGVDLVSFGYPDTVTTSPDISSATVTTTAQAPTRFTNNTTRPQLAAGSYKVQLAPLLYDPAGGYTFGKGTPVPGSGTSVSAGQGLLTRIAQPWTGFTTLQNAIAMCVFVSKGSANPVLVEYGFIDPANDFSFMAMTMGDSAAPSFTGAFIAGTTIDATNVGSVRAGNCVAYTRMFPTTKGVHYNYNSEGFDVDYDYAPKFNIPTVRSCELDFKLAAVDMYSLSQAIGGDYVQYSDATNSLTYEQLASSLYSVGNQLKGNSVIYIVEAKQVGGRTPKSLMLGSTLVNNGTFTLDRQKDANAEIDFKCSPAALDTLLIGVPNKIVMANG